MGRNDRAVVAGLAGIGGGIGWIVGPALVGVVPWYLEVAPFVAPVLLVALGGLADRYYETVADATDGTTGMWSLGCGFALLSVAGVAGLFAGGGVAEAVLVWLPATIGLVAVAVGTGLLGWGLYRAMVLSKAGCAVVVLGLPVALLVNPLSAESVGVAVGFYGVAWVLLGWVLLTSAGPVPVLDSLASRFQGHASVRGVVVGAVGGLLTVAGAASLWSVALGGSPRLGGDPVVVGGLHLATGVLTWLVLLVEPDQARDAVWSLGAFYVLLSVGQVVGLLAVLNVGSLGGAPLLLVVHLVVGVALLGAAADGAVVSWFAPQPAR